MPSTSETRHSRSLAPKDKVKDSGVDDTQAYIDIDKTILDLLKDPVSLGMKGSNGNRGYQR